jgi:hypothetical protein
MSATIFSDRMVAWACLRAARLADEFMAGGGCEREHPAAFFEATCGKERLLGSLRFAAEPAFMARIAELEAGHG